MLRRIAGACCDSSNATSGRRWAGGWRREELMVAEIDLLKRKRLSLIGDGLWYMVMLASTLGTFEAWISSLEMLIMAA